MAKADQEAIAITYRDAAVEHLVSCGILYDDARFVLAGYVAGLAVECILRAYRYMDDPIFDSRQDLQELYKLTKFATFLPGEHVESIGSALNEVVRLWSNEYRYFSDAALRRRWRKQRLYIGIKGDFVKERVRQLVNAANYVVNAGVASWTRSFGS